MTGNELGKRGKQKEPFDDWKLGFGSLRAVNYGMDLLERAKAAAKNDKKQDCPVGNKETSEKNLKHADPSPCDSDGPFITLPHPSVVKQAQPVLSTLSEASCTPVPPSTEPASVPCQSEEHSQDVNQVLCGQKKRPSNVQSLIASFEYSKRPEAEPPKAQLRNRKESTQKTDEHCAVAKDEPFLFRIIPESYPLREISNDQPKIESSVHRVKYEVVPFSEEDFIRLPEGSESDDSTTECSDEEVDSEDESKLSSVVSSATSLDKQENLNFVGSAPTSEFGVKDNWERAQYSEGTESTLEDSLQQIDSGSRPAGCSPNAETNEADGHPDVLYVRVVPQVLKSEYDTEKAAMEETESILKTRQESRDQLSSEDETGSVSRQSFVIDAQNISGKCQEDTNASEPSMENHSPPESNMNGLDERLVSSEENQQMSEKSENTVDTDEYHYHVELFLNQIKEKSTQIIDAEKERSVAIDHDHCYTAFIGPTDCFGDYLCTENVTESSTNSSFLSENTEDESEESQHSALDVDDFSKISNDSEVDYARAHSDLASLNKGLASFNEALASFDEVLKSVPSDESVEENDDESRSCSMSLQNNEGCSEQDESTEKSLAETPENIVEDSIEENFTTSKFRESLDEPDKNIAKLYGTIQESRLSEHQEGHLPEELNLSMKVESNISSAQLPTTSSKETPNRHSDSSLKDENTFLISGSSFYLAPALHLNTKRMFATSRTPESEETEDIYTESNDYETSETDSKDELSEWNDSDHSPPLRKLGFQFVTEEEKDSVKEESEDEIEDRFPARDFVPLADYSTDSETSLDTSEDFEESDVTPILPENLGENSKQIAAPESTLAKDSGDHVQLEIQRRLEESLAQPRTTFEVAPIVAQRLLDKLNPKDATQSKIQRGMTTTLDIRRKHFEPVKQVHTSGKPSEQKLPSTKKLYVYKSSSSKVPVLPADIFKDRPSSEEWESYYEEDSKSEQPVDYYQAPVSESPTVLPFERSDEYTRNDNVDCQYQSSNSQRPEAHCEDPQEYGHDNLWLTTKDLLECVEREDVFDGCLENDGKSLFYFLIAKIYNQGFGEKLLMSCLPNILVRVFNDNDICYFGPNAKGKENRMKALTLVVESQTASMNACRSELMRIDMTAFHQDLARVYVLDSINRMENINAFSDENKKLLVDAVLRIEHYQADMFVLACQGASKNYMIPLENTEVMQHNYSGENYKQYDPMQLEIQTGDYSYQDEPMLMANASECFIPALLVTHPEHYEFAPVELMRQPAEYIKEETILSRPNSAVRHVSVEPVEETYAAQLSEAEYFIRNNHMLYQTYLEKQRMDQSNETVHTHPIEEAIVLYQSGCNDQHEISTIVRNPSVDCKNTSTVLQNWSHFQSYCTVNKGFGNNSGPTYFLNVSMPNRQTGGAALF
ncbi:unnamed protein product [Caenorhabditis brenneri]